MNFADFAEKVKILSNSFEIRNKYIDTFINKQHPLFNDYIESKHEFSDGLCYMGYLWDFIKEHTVISYDEAINLVNPIKEVMVLWDIHSIDRVCCLDDFWHFNKGEIIKLEYSILKENIKNLLEDMYIFDNSFMWTIILTHEEDKQRNQICIKSGSI